LRFLDQAPTARHTALIFCLGNEATVVSSVLMMSDTCRHLKNRLHAIYYHANHEHSAGHLLNREQMRLSQRVPIRIFALENEIFTEDVILNRSLDVMAQRIHLEYLKVTKSGIDSGNPAPAANKPWMDLSDDEREGNNEVADHLWAKLGTLGYALESLPHPRGEKTPVAPIDSALIGESIECNIEELASSEHYRWMAWRLVNGWTYGPVRDNEKKQHPDMVAYERLNEAGKEKDRAIVRIIPDLIRLGMLRMTKVAVPEDQTAPISSTSSQQG